jgi:hypothetical protein
MLDILSPIEIEGAMLFLLTLALWHPDMHPVLGQVHHAFAIPADNLAGHSGSETELMALCLVAGFGMLATAGFLSWVAADERDDQEFLAVILSNPRPVSIPTSVKLRNWAILSAGFALVACAGLIWIYGGLGRQVEGSPDDLVASLNQSVYFWVACELVLRHAIALLAAALAGFTLYGIHEALVDYSRKHSAVIVVIRRLPLLVLASAMLVGVAVFPA